MHVHPSHISAIHENQSLQMYSTHTYTIYMCMCIIYQRPDFGTKNMEVLTPKQGIKTEMRHIYMRHEYVYVPKYIWIFASYLYMDLSNYI